MADAYACFAWRAAASIVVSTAHRFGDHGTLSPPGSSPGKDGGGFPVRFRRKFNKYLLSSPYIVPVVGTGDRR